MALPEFHNIDIQVPFTVLIEPSESNAAYTIDFVADQAVRAAIGANIVGGTLRLEALGNFNTTNPVRVTIRLPANALHGVKISPHPMTGISNADIHVVSGTCWVVVAPDRLSTTRFSPLKLE